jgi:glycosyltransferase involved in cell wall biosynthesis
LRLLWVKLGGLWPLTSGGRLRSFHLVRELSKTNEVSIVTTHTPGNDPDLAERLPFCSVVSLPYEAPRQGSLPFLGALVASWVSSLPVDLWKWRVPALTRRVGELLREFRPDVCVADFLVAVPNIPPDGKTPTVLFEHNVEHLIWKRLASVERGFLRRSALELEWRKMRRYESRACTEVDLTLAVSAVDSEILRANAPQAALRDIPTGVDTDYFRPAGAAEVPGAIAFLGSMDWFPNEEGVLYFIESILPAIRREAPEATFTVIGRNPGPRLQAAAANADVRLTGTVGDVRPLVASASVVVVPLRVGGGTRLKIFEALAMGKAVVSTSIGAEGLPVVPGEHFLRADHPQDFARDVVQLLREPRRRRELGRAGRALVETRHSWCEAAREFERNCREVIHAHAS